MSKVKGAILPWNIESLKMDGLSSVELFITRTTTAPAKLKMFISLNKGSITEIDTTAMGSESPSEDRLAGAFIPFQPGAGTGAGMIPYLKIDNVTIEAYQVGDGVELKFLGDIKEGVKTPWTSGE